MEKDEEIVEPGWYRLLVDDELITDEEAERNEEAAIQAHIVEIQELEREERQCLEDHILALRLGYEGLAPFTTARVPPGVLPEVSLKPSEPLRAQRPEKHHQESRRHEPPVPRAQTHTGVRKTLSALSSPFKPRK